MKKNKKGRRAAGSRHSERTELYFRRKAGGTPIVLLIIAAVCTGYGLLEGGGGPLYFVAAAMLVGLAVWQLFYTKRTIVSGAEVDQWAAAVAKDLNMESRALNALPLDIDDFERAEKIYLTGYSTRPLHKVPPLLRADVQDARGRSCYLQLSCFVLLEESMEVYTLLYSLLDGAEETKHFCWHYGQIAQVAPDHAQAACPTAPAGEEKQNRDFPLLTIQAEGSRQRRSYAISEECMEAAQTLLHWIEQKQERQVEAKQ